MLLTELTELLKVLRDNGVTAYKTPELELVLRLENPAYQDLTITEREKLEAKEDEEVTFAHVGNG